MEEARISKWQYLSTRLQLVRFQDDALYHYRCVNLEFRMSLGFRMVCSLRVPVPVVGRSKAQVCGRSPAKVVCSNPTGGMDVYLL